MHVIRKRSSYGLNRIVKDVTGLLFFARVTKAYSFSEEQFWKYQIKRFSEIYSYSLKRIPYYKQGEYPVLNFNTTRTREEFLAKVSEVPILKKSTLKENNTLFFNESSFLSKKHTTSGTSGTPLQLKATIFEKGKLQMIKNAWFKRICGKLFPKLLILSGYYVPKSSDQFFFIDSITGDVHLSIYALNRANSAIIRTVLEQEKPDIIYGYASAVNLLSLLFEDCAYSRQAETFAVTTSENLEPHWRKNCEQKLVKKLFNFYSSQECVHGIFENHSSLLQINPLMGLVEVLDERGIRVESGIGRVVVTGFMRKSMPLIRYDIGDLMEADGYLVPAGAKPQWPVVGSIFGRAEDLVYKRDGSRIGYLCFHATKNVPEIVEAQLIQEDYERFTCNLVVPSVQSRSSVEERITNEIGRRIGAAVHIDFQYTDFIGRGKNEKFKAVVVNFKP